MTIHTTQTPSDVAPAQHGSPTAKATDYSAAMGDLDLSGEIRLMRAILSELASDIHTNHRAITAVLSVLVRTVYVQAKQLGATSDLERALLEAAELVLRRSGYEGQE